MSNGYDRAAHLLVFYFQNAFLAAGAKFDSDNKAEVESIIDELAEAIHADYEDRLQAIEESLYRLQGK